MDGFCVAQIFLLRKLSALAHTIYANILTDINIILKKQNNNNKKNPPTHTHNHGPPRFVEKPVEKGKF